MEEREARPFAHLDTPLTPLYRRVMRVFAEHKRRFVVHLRPEDVAEALRRDGGAPVSQEAVDKALASLEEWGNLRADPDTSRVTTVEGFYWAGLVIANGVLARFAARPWRMSAGDYLYLAAAAPGGRPLRGDPVVASWDPALHEAMQAQGVAVEEEVVLDDLLRDLAS